MNRAFFNEVVTDISCLVQQITCLERVEIESLEGIANMEMDGDRCFRGSKETKIYNHNYAKTADKFNFL